MSRESNNRNHKTRHQYDIEINIKTKYRELDQRYMM